MAKIPHEAMHRIFRDDPGLFTRTLRRVLAADFPEIEEVSVIDTDLTTTEAIERRADTVLKAKTAAGNVLLVIEPQTDKKESKVRSWAYYLSFLENKYEIPAALMVLAPKAGTARWARGPLTLGPPDRPSMRVFPYVCGPDNMPFITEPEQAAEDVVFTVLALLSHRLNPDVEKALRPLADALDRLEPATASYWFEFTEGGLGEGCTQDTWRNIMKTMNYGYVSETRREAHAEARAEALTEAILAFLDDREVPVSDADRERVLNCSDLDLLRNWVMKAPYVADSAELY
ncbi:hypothetical protein [Glycomyces harbinensis]|uniref:Transposase, YhgA-like n=1 Tax=Glycomyces harbinensis TaxID=58114 RepID=A0A1G6VQF6_9ACTN|nr:hypothetical protein [Glycomyces harbinensis]SDD55095.1 hypothetical protein SAMN05216270_10544 [Glycomyces harbinensis]